MPLLSRLGAALEPSENPDLLYRMAAETLLLHPSATPILRDLLLHLDNNVEQVRDLLIDMLKKRDQWLPIIQHARSQQDLRSQLEDNLQRLITNNLQELYNNFPTHLHSEIITLANFAANNISFHSALLACQQVSHFPKPDAEHLAIWLGLAELLLTKEGEWRKEKGVTKAIGFPSEYVAEKNRFKALLGELSTQQDLCDSLASLDQLPSPYYSEAQWRVLSVLLELLPMAAAQLNTIFREQGQMDFIAVTQAALQALEEEGTPTELALRLDYQINHILVDEFQDTSVTQFRLLELLTAGWQEHDGRTLFLVGDPMQSIYRFRGAEVGLFLRAQRYGIGDVPLTPLYLQANFRSQANIIHWINQTFSHIFPLQEDIASGRVKFMPSEAIQMAEKYEVQLLGHLPEQTGKTVVELIKKTQAENPTGSIAILVRAKSHLQTIIPLLQAENMAYQAVEIERLAQLQIIQDLTALTYALLYLADKLAWLSILRAPWCGLLLADLYIIAQTGKTRTIWQNLQDDNIVSTLSTNGQLRIKFVRKILQTSLAQRQRTTLREWVESTWQALHGPATVKSEYDINNATTFFDLLSQLEQAGSLPNRHILLERLAQLFARPAVANSTTIQLMTIHKAKGLEFDTVIMPDLDKDIGRDSQQLLLWFEQPQEQGGADLLFAPIKEKFAKQDLIYDYLRMQQTKMLDYENSRLLYVAVTRAKQRLYLLAALNVNENGDIKAPNKNTWLGKLWPHCQTEFKNSLVVTETIAQTNKPIRYLHRLSDEFFLITKAIPPLKKGGRGDLLADSTGAFI